MVCFDAREGAVNPPDERRPDGFPPGSGGRIRVREDELWGENRAYEGVDVLRVAVIWEDGDGVDRKFEKFLSGRQLGEDVDGLAGSEWYVEGEAGA